MGDFGGLESFGGSSGKGTLRVSNACSRRTSFFNVFLTSRLFNKSFDVNTYVCGFPADEIAAMKNGW